jgi:hypothetical protein
MWRREFWIGAVERALKTVVQTMLSLWLVGDVAFNLLTVDWATAGGVGAGAFVVSLLTSIASAGIGPVGSPSLVGETDRH